MKAGIHVNEIVTQRQIDCGPRSAGVMLESAWYNAEGVIVQEVFEADLNHANGWND